MKINLDKRKLYIWSIYGLIAYWTVVVTFISIRIFCYECENIDLFIYLVLSGIGMGLGLVFCEYVSIIHGQAVQRVKRNFIENYYSEKDFKI